MKKLIPHWVHHPGAHCASTALSDVMTFLGHDLSEAMCFGLGCGLGFAYFEHPQMSPTAMTATRSRVLEPRFFENIRFPFAWTTTADPDQAEQQLLDHLDHHHPVLLRADIAYLPYYNTKTHFPPHVIALWGYDPEARTVFIADTQWPKLQEVSFEDLSRARYGKNAYLHNQADHYPVTGPDQLTDLKPAVNRALRQQARDLLGLSLEIPALFGFEGMNQAAAAMAQWEGHEDWQWCARWFYQVIEKRGTGGGAFRLLYSRFLETILEIDPAYERVAPAEPMARIAARWTELSAQLKQISEEEHPRRLREAGQLLAEAARQEREFFTCVIDVLGLEAGDEPVNQVR